LGIELVMEFVRQVAEVSGEQELILQFAGGTSRDAEESGEVPLAIATRTLGDRDSGACSC